VGFLDKLNKAAQSVKTQVEQSGVLDKVKEATARGGSSGSPTSPSVSGEPQSVAEGADLADKKWWPTATDVATISGVPVGAPVDVETPESFGWRFTGSDARGAYTFEIHCVREDSMVAAGSARAWIDPHAAAHGRHEPIANLGDYAVAAADGDARFVCYCGVGDALFYVEATSPGVDEGKAVEGIMRKLLDWPA
jgi:hypothetical protein